MGLVYSTAQGRMCPDCGKPVAACVCGKKAKVASNGDGFVRVRRETKGRKGAGVTIITGVPLPEDDLKALAKALKHRCGCGGTVKDGVIEIQGDHNEVLMQELTARGFKTKRAGG